MAIKLISPQSRKVKRLAQSHCCNYCDGSCLLLDDGDAHDWKQRQYSRRTVSRACAAARRMYLHRTGRSTARTVRMFRNAEKIPSENGEKEPCNGDI